MTIHYNLFLLSYSGTVGIKQQKKSKHIYSLSWWNPGDLYFCSLALPPWLIAHPRPPLCQELPIAQMGTQNLMSIHHTQALVQLWTGFNAYFTDEEIKDQRICHLLHMKVGKYQLELDQALHSFSVHNIAILAILHFVIIVFPFEY